MTAAAAGRRRARAWLAALLSLSIAIALMAAGTARAQVDNLPDMGSPADGLLSIGIEAQIGRQVYNDLVRSGSVVTDPEMQEYIQGVGMRLVANANIKAGQQFYFFFVDNPIINAFALPGGYIGVHTGLLLATKNESELAGVLAHEISHVTQRHISRAVFANQRASTVNLAAMLGAILVGVAAGADPGMIQGAVGITQGLAMEQQISFTRSNEAEADRVAMDVLANSGFNTLAMPAFFETMSRRTGSGINRAPEFLLTHPVTTDRMAETRERARNYPVVEVADTNEYKLARARARLKTSTRPELALDYFTTVAEQPGNRDSLELRYGQAIAMMQLNQYQRASRILRDLLNEHEEVIPLHSAYADAQIMLNNPDEALEVYQTAMELFPRNVPLTVRFAEALLRYGDAQQAHDILLDLLNQVPPTLEQVRLIAVAADAAGDTANTHYYMAEYQAMSGNLKLAIEQLVLALDTSNLDSVQRARLEARLTQFQGYLPRASETDPR